MVVRPHHLGLGPTAPRDVHARGVGRALPPSRTAARAWAAAICLLLGAHAVARPPDLGGVEAGNAKQPGVRRALLARCEADEPGACVTLARVHLDLGTADPPVIEALLLRACLSGEAEGCALLGDHAGARAASAIATACAPDRCEAAAEAIHPRQPEIARALREATCAAGAVAACDALLADRDAPPDRVTAARDRGLALGSAHAATSLYDEVVWAARARGDAVNANPRVDAALRALDAVCASGPDARCWRAELGLGHPAGPLTTAACAAGDPRACLMVARSPAAGARPGASVEAWRAACAANLADACSGLADALLRQTPPDGPGALAASDRGCAAHHAASCLQAASLLEAGVLVPLDLAGDRARLLPWCGPDVALGCAPLGRIAEADDDLAAAGAAWRRGCEADDAPSCANLGYFDEAGLAGPADPSAARRWYHRACELRDALSCNNLGRLLMEGEGGDEDVDGAIRVLTQGCDLGEGIACQNLGRIWSEGWGGRYDPAAGKRMYARACALGQADACRRR